MLGWRFEGLKCFLNLFPWLLLQLVVLWLACEHPFRHKVLEAKHCSRNRCSIKCFSQQRAVTWTVCADAQRRGSGRPSGPWGNPSTGNSFIYTLPGRIMSFPRIRSHRQTWQDTVLEDRCWWAGSVVSLLLRFGSIISVVFFFLHTTRFAAYITKTVFKSFQYAKS